jgi:hypothetical protein
VTGVQTCALPICPAEVLKLTKDDVILDVLGHYRNFSYEALTSPD